MYSFKEISSIVEADIKGLEFPQRPVALYEPVVYTLASGGKRIRPASLLMACNIFSDDIASARRAAMAIEVFHNFTLLHDDIMDNADTRRGRATVHRKWNGNVAILSGDVMLIYAYRLLAGCGGRLAELLDIFDRLATEVCEGQQYDMDFEGMDAVSVGSYLDMINGKTAAMLAGALKMGAVCGGASAVDAEVLFRFGTALGLAFQLQDDLLDTYADPEVFGKAVGGDIIEGKKTFLLTTAMEVADEPRLASLRGLMADSDIAHEQKIRRVKEIYDQLGVREITERAVQEYFRSALDTLGTLDVEPSRLEPLKQLAGSLVGRNK